MLKELPLEEFGPGINIREYSFLDNPSVPKEVNEYFYFNGQVTFLDLSLSGEHLLFALVTGERIMARCSALSRRNR